MLYKTGTELPYSWHDMDVSGRKIANQALVSGPTIGAIVDGWPSSRLSAITIYLDGSKHSNCVYAIL